MIVLKLKMACSGAEVFHIPGMMRRSKPRDDG